MAGQQDQRCDHPRDAERTVQRAWYALPVAHRDLLGEVGASQWTIVEEPLGQPVDKLLKSAGLKGLSERERDRLVSAIAVWVPDLRVVVIHVGHPLLAPLDDQAWEYAVTTTAWHEWGHALSIARCTAEDVAAGDKLLDLAPTVVSKSIRDAGYRPNEYTHELVADVYALMIERRQRNEPGRPPWLNQEIYNLLVKATGWPERSP
jgi:hypothetical protein